MRRGSAAIIRTQKINCLHLQSIPSVISLSILSLNSPRNSFSHDLLQKYDWQIGDRVPIKSTIWTKEDGNSMWNFEVVGAFDNSSNRSQGFPNQHRVTENFSVQMLAAFGACPVAAFRVV
jgi:hypothetical protein